MGGLGTKRSDRQGCRRWRSAARFRSSPCSARRLSVSRVRSRSARRASYRSTSALSFSAIASMLLRYVDRGSYSRIGTRCSTTKPSVHRASSFRGPPRESAWPRRHQQLQSRYQEHDPLSRCQTEARNNQGAQQNSEGLRCFTCQLWVFENLFEIYRDGDEQESGQCCRRPNRPHEEVMPSQGAVSGHGKGRAPASRIGGCPHTRLCRTAPPFRRTASTQGGRQNSPNW